MSDIIITHVPHVHGQLIIQSPRYQDSRGFFQELYNEAKLPPQVKACKQVSVSLSHKNVFRGIHTSPYAKLVACLKGRILDIVVDLNEKSPTYLHYTTYELKEGVNDQVFVPAGCGHAFLALDESLVCYAQGGTFNPVNEMDVNYKDPTINLQISQMQGIELIISDKDKTSPHLLEAKRLWSERQANQIDTSGSVK